MFENRKSGTHFTAGAKRDRETVLNPAARTAIACKRPTQNLVPNGIASMAAFPISNTMKKNQSVKLPDRVRLGEGSLARRDQTYFKKTRTVSRNHV